MSIQDIFIEISDSDSESGSEIPDVSEKHRRYVLGKLATSTFCPVQYAKYRKWTYLDKASAVQNVTKVVQANCTEARLAELTKEKKKSIKKNLKALKDFEKGSDWLEHWRKLELKYEKEQNLETRKRAADKVLTAEVVKRANQEIHEEPESNTSKVMKLLDSDLWEEAKSKNIPDCLSQIKEFLVGSEVASDDCCNVFDLRLSNKVLYAQLNSRKDLLDDYADYAESRFDNDNCGIENFLFDWFSTLSDAPITEWNAKLESWNAPEGSEELKKVVEIVKITLPAFIKEFTSENNALTNPMLLECDLLNNFVHPVIKESVTRFGIMSSWKHGELPHAFIQKSKADGVAEIMSNSTSLLIGYFEGSRMNAKKIKDRLDCEKILVNGVEILKSFITYFSDNRKRVSKDLHVYTGQQFQKRITLSVFDVYDDLYIHELGTMQIPTVKSAVMKFVKFYLLIIRWVTLMGETGKVILNAENEHQKRSRRSLYRSTASVASGKEGVENKSPQNN